MIPRLLQFDQWTRGSILIAVMVLLIYFGVKAARDRDKDDAP